MASFLNENIVKGKWKEIKGDLQSAWGRLTDEELETAQGDMTKFTGAVQRKYGLGQEEVRTKLNEMFSKYGDKSEQAADDVRDENEAGH